MPPAMQRALTSLLAVLILLGFVLLTASELWQVWRPGACVPPAALLTEAAGTPQPPSGSARDYVATMIAALVGGIVAVAFGQPERNLVDMDPRGRMITIYAVTYFLLGAAAIATWILREDCGGAYVKNLATTFFGLGLAIVGGYLKGQVVRQARAGP